jgi:phytoene synthase
VTVDDAYALCRTIAHKHGANFSVGFRFLPPVKRRAVYAAYAYCRVADDIADEETGWEEAAGLDAAMLSTGDTTARRLQGLDAWQRELDAAYEGRPMHPITVALADALQQFAIPKSAFVALIDGCRQDMVKTRYETFAELLQYCDYVASSISDMTLSTALQLTNVTRDIGDDVARDRIYVPAEEMRAAGVTERELLGRVENDRMRRLIELQIARAERYFREAEPLLRELDFDARFPTLLMGGIYATVLAKLRKDPLIAIRRRLRLSAFQKLMVVASRLLRPRFVHAPAERA